jgi:hypothetical protein
MEKSLQFFSSCYTQTDGQTYMAKVGRTVLQQFVTVTPKILFRLPRVIGMIGIGIGMILLDIIVFESVKVPVCEQYLTFPTKLKWVSSKCVCHIKIIDATASLHHYSPLGKYFLLSHKKAYNI